MHPDSSLCAGARCAVSTCVIVTYTNFLVAFLGRRPDGEQTTDRGFLGANVIMRRKPRTHGDKVGASVVTAIRKIIGDNPAPRIEDLFRQNGNIGFSVAAIDLGGTDQNYDALCKMLNNRFYTDFLGELILRLNVHQFMDRVAEYESYELNVGLAVHEHFGVSLYDGRIFFTFHASKLAQIANEEIVEALTCPNQKRL